MLLLLLLLLLLLPVQSEGFLLPMSSSSSSSSAPGPSPRVQETSAFLALRNALRPQLVKYVEQSSSSVMHHQGSAAGDGIPAKASTSLLAAIRCLNSSGAGTWQEQLPEALRAAALEFVRKSLAHQPRSLAAAVNEMPASELRVQIANKFTRDALLWTTRALEWKARHAAHAPFPFPGQAPPPTTTTTSLSVSSATSVAHSAHGGSHQQHHRDAASITTPKEAVSFLVSAAQREWRALVHVRLESLKIISQYPLGASRAATQSASNGGGDSDTKIRSSGSGAAPVLVPDDLFSTLVERVNAALPAARRRCAEGVGSNPVIPNDNGPAIENIGLFSSFHSSVKQLAFDCGLLPSITQVREAFVDLDPSQGPPRKEISHATLNSISAADVAFAELVDSGDRPDAICSSAMRGVPPSMRRVVYAKLLQLTLTVSIAAGVGSAGPTVGGNSSGSASVGTLRPLQQSNTSGSGSATNPALDSRRVRFATANAAKSLSDSMMIGRSAASPSTGSGDGSLDIGHRMRQLIRQMVATDVQSRIGDSDKYFVFVDEATAVATAAVEDRNIADHHLRRVLEQRGETTDWHQFLSIAVTSAATADSPALGKARIPASGVMPITGCSGVIGPLLFVTADVHEVYELATAMQGQIWGLIQSCTTDTLGMVLLFESLVAHAAPAAVLHCHTRLGLPPGQLVMRWAINGFADMLEPVEALQLWDVLLAIHCRSYFGKTKAKPFWVLAVCAAAIFVFRAPLLQQCASASQALKIFDDGVKLRPIPLMQQLLFLM